MGACRFTGTTIGDGLAVAFVSALSAASASKALILSANNFRRDVNDANASSLDDRSSANSDRSFSPSAIKEPFSDFSKAI